MNRSQIRWTLAGVVALGAALRLGLLWVYTLRRGLPFLAGYTHGPGNDDWTYIQHGLSLLQHQAPERIAYYSWTPPLIVAGAYGLFGPDQLLLVNMFMIAVSVSIIPAAYALACRTLPSSADGWALVAALAIGLSPLMIRPSPLVLSDGVALSALAWAFVALVSLPGLWAPAVCGLLGGFSTVSRTIYGAALVAGAAMPWFLSRESRREKASRLAVMTVCAAAVVAVKLTWVGMLLGHPVLESNGGVNFFKGNVGDWVPGGCVGIPEWDLNSCYYQAALHAMRAHPLAWVEKMVQKGGWLATYGALDGLTMAAGLAGATALLVARRRSTVLPVLSAATVYALATWMWAPDPIERYKMPLVFAAAILAPTGVRAIIRGSRP